MVRRQIHFIMLPILERKNNLFLGTMRILMYLIFALTLFTFLGCRESTPFKLDKHLSEIGFKIKYDSSPIVGREICACLYFDDSRYQIKQGYFDCLNCKPELVDEKNGIINGCNNKLYMDNDTVKICLTPAETGLYQFHKITLLIKDKSNAYFVADTTFSFNVQPPPLLGDLE